MEEGFTPEIPEIRKGLEEAPEREGADGRLGGGMGEAENDKRATAKTKDRPSGLCSFEAT